jgi:hypothetical protein
MKVEAMISDHQGGSDWAHRVRARISARLADGFRSPVLEVQLLAQFANQYARAGLLDAATEVDLEVVDRALETLGAEHLLTGDVAYNAAMRMLGAPDAGRRAEGIAYLEIATHAYQTAPHAAQRHGVAELAVASLWLHAGESELASSHARRAFALVREQPDRLGLAFALHLDGTLQLRRRNFAEGRRAATEALRVLEGVAATADIRRLRWQIELGLMEALIYLDRPAEARELGISLDEEMGRDKPAALGAELSLRQAQAAFLLGDHKSAQRLLHTSNKSGDLCDALTEDLAIGDVHALGAQLRRARHDVTGAERDRNIAIARYRDAGSDGREREAAGPPWSRPMSGPDGPPCSAARPGRSGLR